MNNKIIKLEEKSTPKIRIDLPYGGEFICKFMKTSTTPDFKKSINVFVVFKDSRLANPYIGITNKSVIGFKYVKEINPKEMEIENDIKLLQKKIAHLRREKLKIN